MRSHHSTSENISAFSVQQNAIAFSTQVIYTTAHNISASSAQHNRNRTSVLLCTTRQQNISASSAQNRWSLWELRHNVNFPFNHPTKRGGRANLGSFEIVERVSHRHTHPGRLQTLLQQRSMCCLPFGEGHAPAAFSWKCVTPNLESFNCRLRAMYSFSLSNTSE